MKIVQPKIFLVAHTALDESAIQHYLNEIGAPNWHTDADGGSKLIEIAGRLCYKAFGIGLNPNVTRVREGNANYIGNLLKQNHGSVLEHVTMTFIIHNISRVFTHELVRHRVGTAISQESLRYVSFSELPFTAVDGIEDISDELEACETAYRRLAEKLTGNFSQLKRLTSLFRRMLPQGVATSILWTVNLRTLRHVLVQRTSVGAEVEMRTVFSLIGAIASELYPAVFQDFTVNEQGEWEINK